MQRMLVGMVLFLTLVMGILAIVVIDLSGAVSDRQLDRPGSVPSRTGADEPAVRPEQMAKLEARLADLYRDSAQLTERLGRTESELRAARAELRRLRQAGAGDGAADPAAGDSGDDRPYLSEPERNPDGEFDISQQDEEFFLAVQKRIEKKRRVSGLTRNVMRRIDRMADKGEIGNVDDETRLEIEQTVRSFVAAGDDIVTRYIREPTEELRLMDSEKRRDEMSDARDKLVAEAQRALTPVLGDVDAAAVAQASLQNPWGVRLRGDRFRRSSR